MLAVNTGLASPWLDLPMRGVSSQLFWGLIVLVLIAHAGWTRRWSRLQTYVFILCVLGASDFLAYEFLKPYFARIRPCKTLDGVRVVAGCAGWESFPSNHATNAMATAVTVLWLGHRKIGLALVLIACLVGLSRVYLGVHYPLDVLGGFVFGAFVASIAFAIRHAFLKRSRWQDVVTRFTK